jgi:hypothetical protein
MSDTDEVGVALAQVEHTRVDSDNFRTMTVEELKMNSDVFDPSCPKLKAKLLEKLGMPETSHIEKLEGDRGAFNEGVWMVSDANAPVVVLKLVPHQRVRRDRCTDREKYCNLQAELPSIAMESSLSFPRKIFQLKGPSGIRSEDLIVMRQAAGNQLTYHLFTKFRGGEETALLDIFKAFGGFLRKVHQVYRGMQHGDCQPSNIFYDESSRCFTMIDVADLGFGPYLAEGGEDDVEHFVERLKTLAQWYGENLLADCEMAFRAGYLEESGKRR